MYALRLLLWDGKFYNSICALYEVEKGIPSVLVVCINEDVRQSMHISLQIQDSNAKEVHKLKVEYHCVACHFEALPSYRLPDYFHYFRDCMIEELESVPSRSKDKLSLLKITLSTQPTTTKVTTLRLTEDMKSIKRFCKHNKIIIVGQDDILIKGKGLFACLTSVSFPLMDCSHLPSYDVPVAEKLFKVMEREKKLFNKYLIQCQEKAVQLQSDNIISFTTNNSTISAEYPIEYALGKAAFCDYVFKVSPAVMIPRKGSETLVETAVKYIQEESSRTVRLLDLGTGSGCLLLSTMKRVLEMHADVELVGKGIDLSADALLIAKENHITQLDESRSKCSFVLGDFTDVNSYSCEGGSGCSWDVILCNPPYSAQKDRHRLSDTTRRYEPATALFADEYHALKAYQLIQQALYKISQDSSKDSPFSSKTKLVLEIGHGQEVDIKEIFQSLDTWRYIETVLDNRGLQRCLVYSFVGKV